VTRNLRFEAYYDEPVGIVWNALTDSRALSEWLMENDFKPVVGHRFQFRHTLKSGRDIVVNGTVEDVQPQRRLVYTWSGRGVETKVIWTLEPRGAGTALVLEHTGFSGLRGLAASTILGMGWRRKLLRKSLPEFFKAHG
jgi:uncharacterized protein YndB with AHSA1/START domain